jgi:hypothetical protein
MSTEKMTVRVKVRAGMVIEAAPIVRCFVGKPFSALIVWMRRQAGFNMERL